MATSKPRITITLTARFHETLKRLAELQGRSMSSVLTEMLEPAELPLQRTVALLEAALEAPRQIREGFAASVEGLEGDLRRALGEASEGLHGLRQELAGDGEAGGTGRAPACGRDPVSQAEKSGERGKSTPI